LLRIVAADSGAAELDSNFSVKSIIATAAVYLGFPYKRPIDYICLTKPFDPDSSEYVVRELELAGQLAKKHKPDQIHIDISLGGIRLEDLNREFLEHAKISNRGKQQLLGVLDKIREVGMRIKKETGSDILFIGKESWAVRIAELTTAACAVKYGVEKALQGEPVIIGLPRRCSITITRDYVIARSLFYDETDIVGYIRYSVPNDVIISEFPNPLAMGFRAIKIQRM